MRFRRTTPSRRGQPVAPAWLRVSPPTAHEPMIHGRERPHHGCPGPGQPLRRVAGDLDVEHDPPSGCREGQRTVGDYLCALGHLRQDVYVDTIASTSAGNDRSADPAAG